jgi:hypothetical protein
MDIRVRNKEKVRTIKTILAELFLNNVCYGYRWRWPVEK